MGINLPDQPRQQRTRQQIGPAIHELRIRRRWSLEELAARASISRSHLSQLERGGSVPSYLILARLAAALGVSVDYFIAVERTSHELDDELSTLLGSIGIPSATWNEFNRLGIEARGALIDALRHLTAAKHDSSSPEYALDLALLADGVAASLPRIIDGIARFGLSALNFMRAWVQLEEQPGERLALGDRMGLMPRMSRLDLLQVYRLVFGADLPDPLLLKWWTRAVQSARARALTDCDSRAIFPRRWIESFLSTGRWGPHVALDSEIAARQLRLMIEQLRSYPRCRIGLVDSPPPLSLLVKGDHGAIVYQLPGSRPASERDAGVALRFAGSEFAVRFRDHFNDLWAAIPAESKESESVIDWFERCLAAAGQRR